MAPASSVRGRLTLLGTALVTVTLVLAAGALLAVQRRTLTNGLDDALRQRVDNMAPAVAEGTVDSQDLGAGDAEDAFVQVLDPAGTVLAAGATVRGLPALMPPIPAGGHSRSVARLTVPRLSQSDFRVLAVRVRGGRTVVVGKNLDDVDDSLRALVRALVVIIPLLAALLALLLWWTTGRTLRQVEAIRDEVETITADRLARRVPVGRGDDEFSRLARTMNAMLDRVERGLEHQRRFVADASHELRSPLTRLRADLELAVGDPPEGAAAVRQHDSELLGDVVALQDLVDGLLFLARNGDAAPPPDAVVDLDDVLLAEARAVTAEGLLAVDTSGITPVRVAGDAAQLVRLVRNLVSNARRHARHRIRLACRYTGAGQRTGEVVVADDGPGIPEPDRERVFERFARLDEARTRDAGGTGLGLAIVADVVRRHGGSVGIRTAPEGGALVVVRLPAALE